MGHPGWPLVQFLRGPLFLSGHQLHGYFPLASPPTIVKFIYRVLVLSSYSPVHSFQVLPSTNPKVFRTVMAKATILLNHSRLLASLLVLEDRGEDHFVSRKGFIEFALLELS